MHNISLLCVLCIQALAKNFLRRHCVALNFFYKLRRTTFAYRAVKSTLHFVPPRFHSLLRKIPASAERCALPMTLWVKIRENQIRRQSRHINYRLSTDSRQLICTSHSSPFSRFVMRNTVPSLSSTALPLGTSRPVGEVMPSMPLLTSSHIPL